MTNSPGTLESAFLFTGPIVRQHAYTRISRRGVTEYIHRSYTHFAFSPSLYDGDRAAAVKMAERFEASMQSLGAKRTTRFEDRLTIRVPHASAPA